VNYSQNSSVLYIGVPQDGAPSLFIQRKDPSKIGTLRRSSKSFKDKAKPKPVIQVNRPSEKGKVEMSDLIFQYRLPPARHYYYGMKRCQQL
jgi:hypothetical protein